MIKFPSIFKRLRRFRRREGGTATMEFAIFFPVFFAIFLSGFELSFVMIRQMWLERALDMTVRDLRLGTWPNVSQDVLKADICDGMGNLVQNCDSELMLELRTVDRVSWVTPNPAATCVDRGEDVQPVTSFEPGTENEMVLIRACILMDPIFPGTALALILEQNRGDGVALVATSGFVNEPGTGTES
ncbi:hypothetical protein ACMU_11485 [Actibacterium mucosum KCTC 23349]|uniref:TadE-like domain-containing protein n=1 Tax=Actibacterium mucosum KCTC 23349 TaxID=1454373 RepID=A0A037ZGQ6_9RHOB|nr:TadE family protein [Actibacterium mucosum]KAJ55313.1 hypothetical protein ACMU_11485 [Actibacterium mucosum KCTC 23349]